MLAVPATREASVNETDLWIRRYFPSAQADAQLICLPHAGGSAPFYRPIAEALSPDTEVLAVQYPGRQDRRREPMLDSIAELADAVAEVLRGAVRRRFAIFGHSMGATLAFEVALRLERAGLYPERIFVSGRRAPSRYRHERVHQGSDDQIVAELRTLAGTDQRVFGDEELLRMVLPAIRNDYRAAETYEYSAGPRLRCPITALAGDRDPKASAEEVQAWSEHTDAGFEVRTYSGGHFYLVGHAREVIELVAAQLRESPSAVLS
jgi:surfactin synthase thioesterase subunit